MALAFNRAMADTQSCAFCPCITLHFGITLQFCVTQLTWYKKHPALCLLSLYHFAAVFCHLIIFILSWYKNNPYHANLFQIIIPKYSLLPSHNEILTPTGWPNNTLWDSFSTPLPIKISVFKLTQVGS